MRIFFAGRVPYVWGGNDFYGMKHYLATYMDLRNNNVLSEFIGYFRDKKDKLELFLDSGAFSVFTVGITVSLGNYISFINRYGRFFDYIACLDQIGAPQLSESNYYDIKKHTNHTIIPVFHFGEPFELLDRYCQTTDYVALGGTHGIKGYQVMHWVNYCKERISKIDRKIEIHIFGMGRMPTIRRLAGVIDSCDTTDWLYPVKYAKVRNRPAFGKNQVTRHQLQHFLRHEVGLFTQLENNINEWVIRKSNEDREQKEIESAIRSFNPPDALSKNF